MSDGVDFNTLTSTGQYFFSVTPISNSSNQPVLAQGILEVTRVSSTVIRQVYFAFNSAGNNVYFVRAYLSSNWSDWRKITLTS